MRNLLREWNVGLGHSGIYTKKASFSGRKKVCGGESDGIYRIVLLYALTLCFGGTCPL